MRTKNLKSTLTLLILLLSFVGHASSAEISGTITNSKTGEPIYGASIDILCTDIEGASNPRGFYTITNNELDTCTVRFMALGYIPIMIRNVVMNDSQTTVIDTSLVKKAKSGNSRRITVVCSHPIQKESSVSQIFPGHQMDWIRPRKEKNAYTILNPVTTVDDLVPQVAGKARGYDEIYVRGRESKGINIQFIDTIPFIGGSDIFQDISVVIADYKTNQPIVGATIMFSGISQSGVIKAGAIFHISNLPDGNYIVTISAIGYFDKVIKNVEIIEGIYESHSFNPLNQTTLK